jgi:hypothetical protein
VPRSNNQNPAVESVEATLTFPQPAGAAAKTYHGAYRFVKATADAGEVNYDTSYRVRVPRPDAIAAQAMAMLDSDPKAYAAKRAKDGDPMVLAIPLGEDGTPESDTPVPVAGWTGLSAACRVANPADNLSTGTSVGKWKRGVWALVVPMPAADAHDYARWANADRNDRGEKVSDADMRQIIRDYRAAHKGLSNQEVASYFKVSLALVGQLDVADKLARKMPKGAKLKPQHSQAVRLGRLDAPVLSAVLEASEARGKLPTVKEIEDGIRALDTDKELTQRLRAGDKTGVLGAFKIASSGKQPGDRTSGRPNPAVFVLRLKELSEFLAEYNSDPAPIVRLMRGEPEEVARKTRESVEDQWKNITQVMGSIFGALDASDTETADTASEEMEEPEAVTA